MALGSKLSLNDAVLKRLLHIRQHNKLLPTREMCSAVFLEELKPLWSRAGIPIKEDKNCIDKVVELWEDYLKLKKIPTNRNQKRLDQFNTERSQLFDLTPTDLYNRMKNTRSEIWEEDYMFYKMQCLNPQVGSMGRADVVTFVREKKSK